MTKGLGRALFASLLGAALLIGAPAATMAAPSKPGPGDQPGSGQDERRGAHSAQPGDQDQGGKAKPGDQNTGKDPKAGDPGNDKAQPPKKSEQITDLEKQIAEKTALSMMSIFTIFFIVQSLKVS